LEFEQDVTGYKVQCGHGNDHHIEDILGNVITGAILANISTHLVFLTTGIVVSLIALCKRRKNKKVKTEKKEESEDDGQKNVNSQGPRNDVESE